MVRLALGVCLLAAGVVNAEGVDSSTRHVSVTGTAISRVQPDTVVWNVTVRRTNRDLAKANAECDATVEKLLELRDELQLKPENVQTGHLSITKVYDRDQFGNTTSFKHFEVVRAVNIRQSDTKRFDEVLAHLIGAADVDVSYQLESSQYHKLRSETRLNAVKAAREKAAAMTELLGAKLGRALRIAEPRESTGSSFISNSITVAPREAEPDKSPGTFAPGAVEIRVSIEVDFEIE